jgi:F0F1-type ATP synthase assembly protein I
MRSTLRYGLITGTVVGIFAISFFSIVNGINNSQDWGMQAANIRGISGLLTILIQATGIYVAMQAVKKQQSNTLTYGQALKTGLLIAVLTAVITGLFSFIYCEFINPGYAQYMVAEAQKVMIAKGETPAQMVTDSNAVRKEFSTGAQVAMALVGQFFVGTMVSFIMGLFIKTKK